MITVFITFALFFDAGLIIDVTSDPANIRIKNCSAPVIVVQLHAHKVCELGTFRQRLATVRGTEILHEQRHLGTVVLRVEDTHEEMVLGCAILNQHERTMGLPR